MIDYRRMAEMLQNAEENHQAVTCITEKLPEFDISDGYFVQNELVHLKKKKGNEAIAFKMGLTSPAKMTQMNIKEPIYGYIFDYMDVSNKGEIVMEKYIHPKVEAEIAFILEDELEGPDITGEQVLEKTKWVLPALEIIDSRYENFNFKLPDVIADNTSASGVVFGTKLYRPDECEIDSVEVTLCINGEIKAHGLSTAVLGNPANSVAMLAKMLYKNGKRKIPTGSIILTGGITEAVLLNKGDHVITNYDRMGNISFNVR